MRLASGSDIVSGETGASGLGGLLWLLHADEAEEARLKLGVSEESSVLVFNTEGATNPAAYEGIVAG
jgi:diaminopropionate ammonia-lyase